MRWRVSCFGLSWTILGDGQNMRHNLFPRELFTVRGVGIDWQPSSCRPPDPPLAVLGGPPVGPHALAGAPEGQICGTKGGKRTSQSDLFGKPRRGERRLSNPESGQPPPSPSSPSVPGGRNRLAIAGHRRCLGPPPLA